MNKIFSSIAIGSLLTLMPLDAFSGSCDYSWQTDSRGRKCGGRAANVRPGGRLGGDGRYQDSYNRPRLYGPNNDPYDSNSLWDNNRKPKSVYDNPYQDPYGY